MESWMKPMLCTAIDDVPVGDEFVMEPKFDGWRLLIHTTGRGCLTFAGRNSGDYSGKLPYIEKEIVACLPPDTCVDGEIIGVSREDVQSVFFTNGGPHIPTSGIPPLSYVIFDILRCNGEDVRDLPWRERRNLLESATFKEHVRLTELFPCNKRTYQVAVATGFEGVVAKRVTSRYSNTRSRDWLKLKAEWTCEALVTGWEVGKGKNAACMGALTCTLLDENEHAQRNAKGETIEIRVGGGFTDTERLHVSRNYEADWHGTVIEVKHNGITASGKVLGPNFVRRRDDRRNATLSTMPRARARTPAQTPRTPAAGSWVRNYGAMGEAKMRKTLQEFSRGRGEAINRVADNNGDLPLNIARCKEACFVKFPHIQIPPGL